MTRPTVGWDEASPIDASKKSLFDDRIREGKKQIREIIESDHEFPGSGQSVNTGFHKKITLPTGSAPTQGADKIIVYAKDVSTKAEFFAIDEDANEVQITYGGFLSFLCPTTQPSSLADGMIWQV